MQLARTTGEIGEPPLWPPLLATRGPGARSSPHQHHAMHLVICQEGELSVRIGAAGRARRAPGVLTAPDVLHAIDAEGSQVLLVFLDPESDVGRSLARVVDGPVRTLSEAERSALLVDASPLAIMRAQGAAWTERVVGVLGGPVREQPRTIHPRVRKLIRTLAALPPDSDTSLEHLAESVGLSPSRLMHVFSESVGIPLRPYLAWLKIQRAAAAIVSGVPLSAAAQHAGFADSAHMSRAFRRMFGMPPSALRPRSSPQPVDPSRSDRRSPH